ncbi:MAG TPA: glutathione S-transferase family protein [Steroidobacteraceae bacterium]|jgi:glutathione S-transferase
MSPVTLFGLERSVYTRVARLALEEKSVAYSLREVEVFGPDGVPAEHLLRHPFGRIPALQHGAFTLYETAAITRYIDEAFTGPALQPCEPQARARMNQIVGILDSYAYRPMVWGLFVQRVSAPREGGTPDERVISAALAASAVCMSAVDQLVSPGPFLLGQQISLADLHALPILRYLSLAPEGLALLSRYASVLPWFEFMLRRPSVIRTGSIHETEL